MAVDPRQLKTRRTLNQIASNVSGVELDDLLNSIDQELRMPLRMRVTGNHTVTVDTINVQNAIVDNDNVSAATGAGNNRNKLIPPISGTIPLDFTTATISFPSTNNNNITHSTAGSALLLNILTDGHYVRIGVNLNNLGQFVLTEGSQSATITGASAPPVTASTFGIGHILVRRSGSSIVNLNDSMIFQYIGGGGGGGGLSTLETSTAVTPAEAGYNYLCNTSSAGFTITLPAGAANAVVGIVDARETFGTNNLTITPASGEKIDGYAVDESLVLDVSGIWVELGWSVADARWTIKSAAPGSSNQVILQNGNIFAAGMVIGTNDNNSLAFKVNNNTVATASTGFNWTLGNSSSTKHSLILGASGALVVGDDLTTASYSGAARGLLVGTTTATTTSLLGLVGNRTIADTAFASMSFHNEASAESLKRAALLQMVRGTTNNVGYLTLQQYNTTATALIETLRISEIGGFSLGNSTATGTTLRLNGGTGNLSGTNYRLGIEGRATSAANAAVIQLGDNESGSSRQWAISNGWANGSAIGSLNFLVSTTVNTDALNGSGVIAMTLSPSGAVTIPKTTDQLVLGVTNTTTITAPAPAASRIYTIPDAGGAASFVMTAGTQTLAGAKTFSSLLTASAGLNVTGGVLNVTAGAVGSSEFVVNQSGNDVFAYLDDNTGARKIQLHSASVSYFTGGSVGIGTPTPDANARLQVAGGALRVHNDSFTYPSSSIGNNIRRNWITGDSALLAIYNTADQATNNNVDLYLGLKKGSGASTEAILPFIRATAENAINFASSVSIFTTSTLGAAVQALSASSTGAVTLGPASGGALTHTAQSNGTTNFVIKSPSAGAPTLFLERTGATSRLIRNAAGDLQFIREVGAVETIEMQIASTGALTVGSATTTETLTISSAANHTSVIIGSRLGTLGRISGGYPYFGSNAYSIGTASEFKNNEASVSIPMGLITPGRREDGVAGGGIYIRSGEATANTTVNWSTFNPVLTWTTAGAVTLGPSAGLTSNHRIQTSSSAGGEVLTLAKTGVAVNTNHNFYMTFRGTGNSADGFIQTNGSAVLSIVDSSDERVKTNVKDATYGLNTILQLNPVEFDWINGPANVKGFIAQQVKSVLPESVMINPTPEYEDFHYLETQTMIPVLVKAVQELKTQLDEATARIAELEAAP